MKKFVEVFKALSDKTRLRIIHLLCKSKIELCVCEIVDSIEESQYNISRHLKILKNADLIKEKKEGRWVRYKLNIDNDTFKKTVFKAISTISHPLLLKDYQELKKRIAIRVNGKCLIGIKKKHLIGSGKKYGKR